MCIVSPVTGWRTSSLTTTGVAAPPSTLSSSTAPAWASASRSVARVDLERDGVLAAAVDDAGHVAGAAQAARRARAAGLAALDRQSCRWWSWAMSGADGSGIRADVRSAGWPRAARIRLAPSAR